jgi:broad specificity phosphatase PhoE
MRSENMIGALDQQRPEVDIASLGDAELRVVVPGLAASRPQAEVTADIPTSLEAFLAAQRQNVRQCRELADAIDLDQRLRLWVLRLRESLDGTVVLVCPIFCTS